MGPLSLAPGIPLRRHLITLVVVAVVPVLLFALVMVVLFGREERVSTERGLRDVTRALTVAVDRELETSLKTLEALAGSLHLDTGDLHLFAAHVERVLPTQPRWRVMFLTDAAGQPLPARRSLGVPPGGRRDYIDRALATGTPAFSDFILDDATQAPTIAIVTPVVRAGRPRYVLGAALDLTALSGFVAAHALSPDWTATILDRNGIVLARSRAPEKWLGHAASPALDAPPTEPATPARDGGVASYLAHARSAVAGWTITVSVPVEAVDAPLRRSLAAAVAGGLVLLGGGALLAAALGRRLARPIQALVASAEALGRGEAVTATETPIAELRRLASAIETAAHERERFDRALRASETELRAIFTSTLDGIVVADDGGRFVDANPAAEDLFGLPRAALLTRRVHDFAPPGTDVDGTWEDFLRKGSATGTFRLLRPDGGTREAEFSATANVMPGRHVSVLRDVTARGEADAELRRRERESSMIAEVTQRINARLDLDTILLSVCRSARDVCMADGATIALPEAGRPDVMTLRQRVSSDGAALPATPIERGKGIGGLVMATGRPMRSDDYTAESSITRDYTAIGERLGTRAVMVVPIRVADRVEGLIYVANRARRPFTDRDEAVLLRLADHAAFAIRNARLLAREQAALAESEAANRSKDDFLATLSHELRTPLTSMLGWVRMLRGARLDSEQATRALETIERNTRLQAKLIDDLLDVSRIVAGKIKLESQRVDLGGVVGDVVQSMRREAETADIALEAAVEPGAVVAGDPMRLQQTVANLLSNALKFTPAGGRVDVRLTAAPGIVRLVVRDTGTGIAPTVLPHVFDRFRQGDASSTRGRGGLGLGLAIVRHLVELHGGRVTAASDGPGTGATFTITLPAIASGAPVETPSVIRVGGAAGRRLDGVRVLAVEDHEDSRELLRAALVAHGAETFVVSSVDEALSVLDRERVDVLVSDLGMPDRDGYALVEALRELERARGRPAIPAIALTAFAGHDHRTRVLAAGFQVHVAKPIDPDLLSDTIARTLGPR